MSLILGLLIAGAILAFVFLPMAWALVVLLSIILIAGTIGLMTLADNMWRF